MVVATPIVFSVLAVAGEITIPAYTRMWAILICGQSCFFVISCMGAIAYEARVIGTIATMCIVVVHWCFAFLMRLWLLVCSYTINSFLGLYY